MILSTSLALTSEDQDQQIDIYLWDFNTQQYRLISRNSDNIGFDGEAQFSAAGDVVFLSVNQSDKRLIVQPLSGARREWPLPPEYDGGFRLLRITPQGQAALANNLGRRLVVDLQTGAWQFSSGAVVGDERLLQAKDLSLSLDGNSLATVSAGNQLQALRSDGAARESLPAEFVSRVVIDDDPRYIAFVTTQALLPEDSNLAADVYEWDRALQQVRRLSRRPDGTQTSGGSVLLAYSRSEGIALVQMSRSDLGVPNAASFFVPARIELASGVVSPVLGFVSAAYAQFSTSRNGRWILAEASVPNPDRLLRLDTRNSALTPVDALLGGAYTVRSRSAISDSGQRALVPIALSTPTRSEVRLVDFANNSSRAVFQTPDRAIATISPDGRSALIGTQRVFALGPPPPPSVLTLPLYVLDLELNLLSEQIGLAMDRTFGFSGDGSKLGWLGANRNVPTGNVMLRANPYFRTPSFTAIVRVQPALPTRTDTLLVEAVVSHKDAGPAASGMVRFDDGYGAQCDAVLEAQGELAIARCRLLPNAESLVDSATLSLRANYLGDRRYGASSALRSVQASKQGCACAYRGVCQPRFARCWRQHPN